MYFFFLRIINFGTAHVRPSVSVCSVSCRCEDSDGYETRHQTLWKRDCDLSWHHFLNVDLQPRKKCFYSLFNFDKATQKYFLGS